MLNLILQLHFVIELKRTEPQSPPDPDTDGNDKCKKENGDCNPARSQLAVQGPAVVSVSLFELSPTAQFLCVIPYDKSRLSYETESF